MAHVPAVFPAISYDECKPNDGLQDCLSRLFDIREHDETLRSEAKAFISACFAESHGARIRHFMPRLLSLCSHQGTMIAAFGLRRAAQASLFLEHYLERPVEDVLQMRLGSVVHREEIIEVGNMSALYPGAARWLIVAVTALLQREGYRWVVFTGTSSLRNGFSRLGLRPIELGAASLSCLPEHERTDWGSYYDHAPMVMAGDIAHGYQSLLDHKDLYRLLRHGIAPIEAAA